MFKVPDLVRVVTEVAAEEQGKIVRNDELIEESTADDESGNDEDLVYTGKPGQRGYESAEVDDNGEDSGDSGDSVEQDVKDNIMPPPSMAASQSSRENGGVVVPNHTMPHDYGLDPGPNFGSFNMGFSFDDPFVDTKFTNNARNNSFTDTKFSDNSQDASQDNLNSFRDGYESDFANNVAMGTGNMTMQASGNNTALNTGTNTPFECASFDTGFGNYNYNFGANAPATGIANMGGYTTLDTSGSSLGQQPSWFTGGFADASGSLLGGIHGFAVHGSDAFFGGAGGDSDLN